MLAKKPLTDRTIAAVKPALPGKRKLLWDAVVPGLALRVTDTGAKSLVLVTRYPGSRHLSPSQSRHRRRNLPGRSSGHSEGVAQPNQERRRSPGQRS